MKAPLCLLLAALMAAPAAADTIINFDDLPLVTGNTGLPGNSSFFPNNYDGLQWLNMGYFTGTNSSFTGINSAPNAGVTTNSPSGFALLTDKPFTLVSLYLASAVGNAGQGAEIGGFDSNNNLIFNQVISLNAGPTLYTLNFTNVLYVLIGTEFYTTIDDIDLNFGSTNFSSLPGLNSNERGIASSIDTGSNGSSSAIGNIVTALGSLPVTNVAGALDELSPAKVAQFYGSTAVNNAAIDAQQMDSYLAGRLAADGTFAAGNGQIDTHNFVVQDANVDPGLQMIHSRMLAWNDLPSTISDVPSAVLGGVDMKDAKVMKTATAPDKPWNVFVQGSVILAQQYSEADIPHSHDDTASVLVGADYRVTPNLLVGITGSYAHTDGTLDADGSSATVDSYSPGIYASYADSGWYSNFVGRYSYNTYTSQRNIAFLGQSADGATTGNEGTASLDGGYNFHAGALTYGPIAGLQYTHLTVNSYTEQNSDADLAVNEDQTDSLRSRLGGTVRISGDWAGVTWSPHLEATWQHEFFAQGRGLTSQFTQFSGGSFTVRTDSPSRDSALVDAGLDAQLNDTVTLYADYLVEAGQSNYFGQSVQAGVRINF